MTIEAANPFRADIDEISLTPRIDYARLATRNSSIRCMLFNSLGFLVFYPLAAIAFFICPKPYRWLLLLCASYYFYSRWQLIYVGLIILSTLLDFHVALAIENEKTQFAKRSWLAASLVGNLGLLFFFKYYNFLAESLNAAQAIVSGLPQLPNSNFLLPVGISFYTFQTLSYTFEVYLGRQKAETRFGIFALYVAFFPQLVAGPIERPQHLLWQLKQDFNFDYGRAVSGLQLMLWGFFKKMVVADNLARVVDHVYDSPADFTGPAYTVATVFFAFQIFCDFSGYSDIAIGAARLLGVDLMKNFDRPYFSKSIPEFWRRWHISLSTWFRDYVFIPLGGSRISPARTYFNLLVVFLASGLWHGAAWNFLVWGLLHFVFYAFGAVTASSRAALRSWAGFDRVPFLLKPLQTAATFSLVCFGWIFFRANSMTDAGTIVRGLVSGWSEPHWIRGLVDDLILVEPFAIVVALAAIILMEGFHLAERTHDVFTVLNRQPLWLRWSAYYGLVWIIISFGAFDGSQFIYFQF